ncbi:MAG TPA: carbamoyltransferase HypF [Spirochaetia bacterium]|nr:carbamoyltransferase HypF [Spirochaetia bacterium]
MVNVKYSRYSSAVVRRRFEFRGTIQGVGFRPAVFRVAESLRLAGFVQNRRSEVIAEVQGAGAEVDRFLAELRARLPGAARLESVREVPVPAVPEDTSFRIRESKADRFSFPPIPPDLPTCADCARELLDRENRRYLYPFITCTQCGPRYSIVERTPFDRENTSMSSFLQCPDCAREYGDPADRRFHSQTNSCPNCGPRLVCVDRAGRELPGDPLAAAVNALARGQIIALQGIGGFHLAADPRLPGPMEKLRRAKERERKPFALMVRDLREAEALCTLDPAERELLSGSQCPIVISPRASGAPSWLTRVSGTETLGIMLPYTPLHLLLFSHPALSIPWRHLVMTSGNRASEPIITDPRDARERLGDVADLFLVHDRKIIFRTDDSVVRAGPSSAPFMLRRSRGYVPGLVPLSADVKEVILGVGGDLKSAPSLARGRDVHLCPFNGDLDDPETREQFETVIMQTLALYGTVPDVIVHDLHPLYHSTAWALGPRPRELGSGRGIRTIGVQHHYAHALSVMAEHGLDEALALSFDGTGFGTDGVVWGGEFLHATRRDFRRLGSFSPFALPGGDAAVLNPPRLALSILGPAGAGRIPGLDASQEQMILAMVGRDVNSPKTTSLGRIFDAAAAALGLVKEVSYEGEGPIRLEGFALRAWNGRSRRTAVSNVEQLLPFIPPPQEDERLFLIDSRPLILHLAEEHAARPAARPVESLALLFHEAVAAAALEGAHRMGRHTGIRRLALSGGVFQNLLLRELLVPSLRDSGFEVFLNEKVPPGDGGLSVGQIWHQSE